MVFKLFRLSHYSCTSIATSVFLLLRQLHCAQTIRLLADISQPQLRTKAQISPNQLTLEYRKMG